MDLTIWNSTIMTWVNCLRSSPSISSIQQLQWNIVEEVVRIIDSNPDRTLISFLREIFPNYNLNEKSCDQLTNFDCVCLCSLILTFVCLSCKNEHDALRQKMCLNLEDCVQNNIVDFLVNIQNYNIFSLTSSIIKEEILKFSQRHSLQNIGDGDCQITPVKGSKKPQNEDDSPLLVFLQTPIQRSIRNLHPTCFQCKAHLRKIKELTEQLEVKETQNLFILEKLNAHILKCNDYENKLKSKLEEIKDLQQARMECEEECLGTENLNQKLKLKLEEAIKEKQQVMQLCSSLHEEVKHLEQYNSTLEEQLLYHKSALERIKKQLKESTDTKSDVKKIEMEEAMKEYLMQRENFSESSYLNDSVGYSSLSSFQVRNLKNLEDEEIVFGEETPSTTQKRRRKINWILSYFHFCRNN